MKVSELVSQLKELPQDADIMDYSGVGAPWTGTVKYEECTQTVWFEDKPRAPAEDPILTPEKHLAAILAAWTESDGVHIHKVLRSALTAAEADFDGVEGY